MKDGVRLINCARGGLYDEDALYNGVKSGKIAYAGIDVFIKEPATDNKLLDLENISVTPHLGANTKESQQKIATQAVEQAMSAAFGVGYPHSLNLPIDESKLPSFVKPYLELSQKIGYLASQVNKGYIKSIRIEAEGEIAAYLDSLKTFALVGALKDALGEKINYVNAEFVAEEKAIELCTKETTNRSAYKNKIKIKLTTDQNSLEIGGTVFADSREKIISVNDIKLEFTPKGRILFFANEDKAGVIANISRILSDANINIADFRLGRNSQKEALAVVLVDQEVTKDVLKELNDLSECYWASIARV
jgi:D-3-phosphoglycerate dehydrogenase